MWRKSIIMWEGRSAGEQIENFRVQFDEFHFLFSEKELWLLQRADVFMTQEMASLAHSYLKHHYIWRLPVFHCRFAVLEPASKRRTKFPSDVWKRMLVLLVILLWCLFIFSFEPFCHVCRLEVHDALLILKLRLTLQEAKQQTLLFNIREMCELLCLCK